MFGAITFKQFENALILMIKNQSPYDLRLKDKIINVQLNGKTLLIIKDEKNPKKYITVKTGNGFIKSINIENNTSGTEYTLNTVKADGSGNRSLVDYNSIDSDGRVKNEVKNINLSEENDFNTFINDMLY